MSNPTVYVETTVIGHIAARVQSDILVAARQLSSKRWWDIRDRYQLVASQIVVDECAAGDAIAATERLALLDGLAILKTSNNAKTLADDLIVNYGIPDTEPRDALHISIAAVHGIQYLVTWNFRHIANAETRSIIERVCREKGYTPPLICSPDEMLGL
jgi:predicted nucleic acid-binding protein